MVAGAGDCAWNTARQPFLVSGITYKPDSSVAHLKAAAVDWQTAIHTYDLEVGSIDDNVSDLQARDVTRSLAVNIAHKFTPNAKWTKGDLSLELSCADCHTAGTVRFGLVLRTKLGIPYDAYISLAPQAVSAMANLKFDITGTLVNNILDKEITPITIPLTPINIGKFLIVGPELSFGIGVEVGEVSASADFTLGAEARLAQGPFVRIDLLNPTRSKFKGWTPSITMIDPTVSRKISMTGSMYTKVSLNMDVAAISKDKPLSSSSLCLYNRSQTTVGW